MNKYIPVQNNIDKALAFAPSLNENYFGRVMMRKPEGHINTVETIEKLQNEGWYLQAVAEQLNHERKVASNQVRMYHPDITMDKPSGEKEGTSNLYISNSMTKNDMELALGFYRLVCSNGMVRFDGDNYKIKSVDEIQRHLDKIEEDAQQMIIEFQNLKEFDLSSDVQKNLAKEALKIRFGGMMAGELDYQQLLKVNRPEDKGDNVWSIYNRIQEGIIKPNMLTTKNGTSINGVYDIDSNIRINQALYTKLVVPFTTIK